MREIWADNAKAIGIFLMVLGHNAMDKFKMEIAGELGVPLTNGYNGNLTSYQNGSVGGYMVKKMIEEQEKKMAGK